MSVMFVTRLHKAVKNKKGKHPVVLQITWNRNVRRKRIGIWARPNQLFVDDEGKARLREIDGKKNKQKKLKLYEKTARRIFEDDFEDQDFDYNEFCQKLDSSIKIVTHKKVKIKVAEFCEQVSDNFKKSGQIRSSMDYNLLKELILKISPNDLTFSELNITWLQNLENYFNAKGTRGFDYMNRIKVLYNKAIQNRLVDFNKNPFKNPYTNPYGYDVGKLKKRRVAELGHAFNLYHTFEGDCSGGCCPTNNNPGMDGDRCEDTPPHIRSNLDCDPSSMNGCDGGSSSALFVYNHMDYSDETCRNQFTDDQRTRIRCTLMDIRSSLMNSIACQPACNTATAAFKPYELDDPQEIEVFGGSQGIEIFFENQSNGDDSWIWYINGIEESDEENLTFEFEFPGTFEICLRVQNSNTGCIDQECVTIEITPGEACFLGPIDCQLVFNGSLNQNSLPLGEAQNVNDQNVTNVCNWDRIFATPFFCSEVNDDNAFGLFSDGFRNHHEGVVTQNQLDLEIGAVYQVSFEYSVANKRDSQDDSRSESLLFGLTNDPTYYFNYFTPDVEMAHQSDQIIVDLLQLPYDYNSVQNVACYAQDLVFHYHEEVFIYEGGGSFLYVVNIGDPNPPNSDNIIYVKNILVTDCNVKCEPAPSIVYDIECPKLFTGQSDVSGSTFVWHFDCDNTSYTGSEVTKDLPEGECKVCLTVSCDLETSEKICETITIPPPSDDCKDVCTDLIVELQTCKQKDGEINSFLANFDIAVPVGTWSCSNSGVISNSIDVDINLTSMKANEDEDIISFAIEITTPINFDLLDPNNGVAGNIILCDPQGNVICYTLSFIGSECDTCEDPKSSTAICVDTDPMDEVYEYISNETIIFELDPFEYKPCGEDVPSSELGYNGPLVPMNDHFEVNYTITSNNSNLSNVNTLYCFENILSGATTCFVVNIDVETCTPLPTDCVVAWSPKGETTCTKSSDGTYIYNFGMDETMDIQMGPYQLCDGDLFGTIEGGEVVVDQNEVYVQNGLLIFNVELHFDCDNVPGNDPTPEVILYLCDSEGQIVCYKFQINLASCNLECNRSESSKNRNKELSELIKIYPNPVSQNLTIEVDDFEIDKFEVILYNQLGRLLMRKSLDSPVYMLNLTECNEGIHLLQLIDNEKKTHRIEKLIIMH